MSAEIRCYGLPLPVKIDEEEWDEIPSSGGVWVVGTSRLTPRNFADPAR
jgi:hypothetical protein